MTIERLRTGDCMGRSWAWLKHTQACRDGERRDCNHNRDDARQCKAYPAQRYLIGHGCSPLEVLSFVDRCAVTAVGQRDLRHRLGCLPRYVGQQRGRLGVGGEQRRVLRRSRQDNPRMCSR